jgi:putative hydrolase of the HAD superfamily
MAVGDQLSAVLFDLDNTLFDRDRAFTSWAEAFVQTRLAPQDDLRRREALGLLLSLDTHGYGSRPAMFATLKKAYPILSESVDSLVEAFYRQLRDYVSLDEGARRLLDTLDRSGVPFGIVTNGSHRQLHKIEALGLDTRATCIFVSDVFGCRKPEAAIFLAAASCLNARPAEILFVGDDPEADMWGAHCVGMRTAWLHRRQAWPPALPDQYIDLTVGSLDELADMVEASL